MRGNSKYGESSGSFGNGEIGTIEMRFDEFSVVADHQIAGPFARFLGSFGIQVGAGAGGLESPFLQQCETWNFGQIEVEKLLGSFRCELDFRVMIDAEIAHRVSAGEGCKAKKTNEKFKFFHYTVPTNCTTL